MARVYKQLAKLTLATSFGRGADQPLRKARLLITGGSLGLLAAGRLAAESIGRFSLARDIPPGLIFVISAVTVFMVASFLVLPLSQMFDSRQSINNRNLIVLPLSRLARWFVVVLPILIVAASLSLLFLPILGSLSRQLNSPPIILLAAYLTGLSAAVGLAVFNGVRSITAKYFCFVGLSLALLYLLDQIIKSARHKVYAWLIGVTVITLVLTSLGTLYRYFRPVSAGNKSMSSSAKLRLPKTTLKSLWFVLKILRNRRTLASFSFCLIIGTSFAVFNFIKHKTMLTPQSLIVFGSVLAASLACDVRGICRHYKTPEIHLFRGVNYFVSSQVRSLILLNLLVIAPLFVYLANAGVGVSSSLCVQSLVAVLAGSLLGLLSSAVFVPENGEIGSQFFSALLAISGLLLTPKLFNYFALGSDMQSLAWLCVAGLCCLIILMIEDRRRKIYGHI